VGDPSGDAGYQNLPRVTLEQARIAQAKKLSQRKARPGDRLTKICGCSLCGGDGNKEYDVNMSKGGPERLCTVQLDIGDLLQMMGADTEENLATVERMCELSVAAFDIESMTASVDLEQPERLVSYRTVGGTSTLGGHIKKVQKPVMISHMDALSYEASEDGETLTVTSEGDSERDIYKMMERYWSIVQLRKERAVVEKTRLSAPLFDMLNEYFRAHADFFSAWQEAHGRPPGGGGGGAAAAAGDKDTIRDGVLNPAKVWKQSVPGKLLSALASLRTEYCVFSFYG
jgi:hypothetical protein